MQHITCDYCGKELAAHDARYALRMEARLVCEAVELTDADLDEQEPLDPVDVMEDWLASDDTVDESAELSLPVAPMAKTYDLCGRCYGLLHADPLGLDRVSRLQFSDE